MANDVTQPASSLLKYLPEIYSEDPFLGYYLAAFEKILLRNPDKAGERGLEQKIESIASYFNPLKEKKAEPIEQRPPEFFIEQTPPEFLQWLSGWVALSLRADLNELRQREFIRNAVRLYQLRGTKKGLEEVVSLYTQLGATITEPSFPFQVETTGRSRVGDETVIEGGAPFVFHVLINLSTTDTAEIKKQYDVVMAILNMEKPSHTQFILDYTTPIMQIEDHSQVEKDTLLG
jgi:phage tail-like protein